MIKRLLPRQSPIRNKLRPKTPKRRLPPRRKNKCEKRQRNRPSEENTIRRIQCVCQQCVVTAVISFIYMVKIKLFESIPHSDRLAVGIVFAVLLHRCVRVVPRMPTDSPSLVANGTNESCACDAMIASSMMSRSIGCTTGSIVIQQTRNSLYFSCCFFIPPILSRTPPRELVASRYRPDHGPLS